MIFECLPVCDEWSSYTLYKCTRTYKHTNYNCLQFVYSKQRLARHANLFFSPQDEHPQILRLIPLTRISFLGPPVRNFQTYNFLLLIHKSQIRKFNSCASPLIANPQKFGSASRKRIGSANRKKDWVRKAQV